MGDQPNILYIHSHDTGRYVQPYGHAIPTPNIQWLADQGVMFRNAFCAAPSCSGSRAALLTGRKRHKVKRQNCSKRGDTGEAGALCSWKEQRSFSHEGERLSLTQLP